jgi:hypothetical protein
MYIGIDNGKKGALVSIDDDGSLIETLVMPILNKEYDILEIMQFFLRNEKKAEKLHQNCVAVLEKCHTMPLNGHKANFTNGFQYGVMQTLLKTLCIPFVIVGASTWQKVMFKGMTVKDTKSASIDWCLNRFPKHQWKGSDRCTTYHDGLTDACLLAMYGREKQL